MAVRESEVVEIASTVNAIAYPVQEFEISEMAERMLSLKINGPADKEGAVAVQKALTECVTTRTAIDKKRKELKAESLEYGRKVDAVAKSLVDLITPIEEHLKGQKLAVVREQERLAKIIADAVYADRRKRMDAESIEFPERYIRDFSNEEFDAWLFEKIAEKREKEEKARLAAEQAEANRIERERLEAEHAELKRQREIQQAEIDRMRKMEEDRLAEIQRKQAVLHDRIAKLKAVGADVGSAVVEQMDDAKFEAVLSIAAKAYEEQQIAEAEAKAIADRIALEEAEERRKAEIKRAADAAAERAARETEDRLRREAEAREKARLAEIERLRKEAELKPAKDKIAAYCSAVKQLPIPELSEEIDKKIRALLNTFVKAVGRISDELSA